MSPDEHRALIVVDVQNDFASPDGSLHVDGADRVVEVANREIGEARARGDLTVYTADWHPPDTPHFEKDGGTWPVHCVADTWGAQFHPDLDVDGEVVRKGVGGEDGYSGFTMRDPETGDERSTGLQELLDRHGIEQVRVLGLATDVCVKATVLDARQLGYPTEVVTDGVAGVEMNEGDSQAALDEMAEAGATLR